MNKEKTGQKSIPQFLKSMETEGFDCRNAIVSNDYVDIILSYAMIKDEYFEGLRDYCGQQLSDGYFILHVSRERTPEISLPSYTYVTIPKCYGLQSREALEASGIIRLQNQPVLQLRGQGVLVGIIDTGGGVIKLHIPVI